MFKPKMLCIIDENRMLVDQPKLKKPLLKSLGGIGC